MLTELPSHIDLDSYREKWIRIGLATGPADRGKAEQAIADCYRVAGLAPPEKFLWLPSPLHGALAVGESVRESVEESVGESVWESVWQSVGQSVWQSVWESIRESVGGLVREELDSLIYGQHDAHWLAYYDVFDAADIAACQKTRPLRRAAEEVGWWWAFERLCTVTERPTAITLDSRGRLHNAQGPALDYGGAWGVWAWHGVRVPQHVIESPETLLLKEVLNEENTEVRRVMLTRIGPERLAAELPERIIDQDTDGRGQQRKLTQLGQFQHRGKEIRFRDVLIGLF